MQKIIPRLVPKVKLGKKSKGPFTQAMFVAQLNEIIVALKFQPVAISSRFLQFVSAKRQCTSISYTKTVHLLKSETGLKVTVLPELHLIPRR